MRHSGKKNVLECINHEFHLYQHSSTCVDASNITSKYDMMYDLGVNNIIFAVCYFWYVLLKSIYLENPICKICLRQSAKTAQT